MNLQPIFNHHFGVFHPYISWLRLLFIVSVGFFPVVARGQFTYITNADNTLTITHYNGLGGAVTIPTNINGLSVTAIGDEAFFYQPSLTSLTIPSGVTSVGREAFCECTSLGSLLLPASLTNIAEGVCGLCPQLTNAPIPAAVISIGGAAFNACGLTTVNIPSNVKSIGSDAFAECENVGSVTIPSNVTSIGDSAFAGCAGLTNATLYGITTLADEAFGYCTSLATVTLPGTLTEIIGNPFDNCPSLTGVFFLGNFPDSVSGMPDSGLVFTDNPGLNVYRLPGTSNWDFLTAFSGLTALMWNPLIETGNANFGVQNNQFGFDITGTPAIPIAVEAATNLANPVWTPLTNVTLTNALFQFSEPAQPNTPNRYYRIASPCPRIHRLLLHRHGKR